MMMAGISFAAATPQAGDAAPAQQPAASDKGHAFDTAFSAAQPQPAEVKNERPASKDKDRKAGKAADDTTTASAAPAPVAPAPAHPAGKAEAKKADEKAASTTVAAKAPGKTTDQPADPGDSAIDTRETAVDAAHLAPVLDALKQVAGQVQAETAQPVAQPETPAAQAAAAAVEPLPATASLLAQRIVPATAQVEAKPAAPAKKSARAEAAADKAAAIDTAAASVAPATQQADTKADTASATDQPDAGQQLAAGAADRALDMAKQGAWLDDLARDIAATGDTSSTLRFQAAPTHLGAVQVEIARGLEGAAVTLTASSETARTALADARPQLIDQARAQGIHIASAQVDVSTDSRQSSSNGQPEHRHDPRSQAGLSSQTGGEGARQGGKQTRSQPFAVNQTADSQPVVPAETVDTVPEGAPAGGMYA